MPFKTFIAGNEATAVDVNDYLMKQAVSTFTNATTRSSGISAPVKGQVTARDDAPGVLEVWDGTGWVSTVGVERMFVKTLNQTCLANSSSSYVLTMPAMPQAGGLSLDVDTRVDSLPTGSYAQGIAFTYDPGTTTPAPYAAVAQNGFLYHTTDSLNLKIRIHWTGLARNQVVSCRLMITNNMGAGASVNWANISGIIRVGPVGAPFS